MGRLIDGYIDLLQSEGNPSSRFWELERRLRQDKRRAGVSVEMSRSKMSMNIMALLKEGAISLDDLEGFSSDYRELLERRARILEIV